MELERTKYPTNTRVVSGTPTIYPNDVVLECNTLLGPVVINLLEIPLNYWSTQNKIYIVDSGNNALVNNITINAPVGFKINGGASTIISQNGGSYIVRVVSNTNYVAQYSASGGAAISGHTIQDEGASLPQRTFLDFVGGGVGVTDFGGKTRVDIPIQDYDTGWIDLLGFAFMVNKPQYRIINRILQFRGVAVVPINDGGVVKNYADENSYINFPQNSVFTGGGPSSAGIYTSTSAPNMILAFNSSGNANAANTIPTGINPIINNVNRLPDNVYAFDNLMAYRRVRSTVGAKNSGVVYNVPITLLFDAVGSMYISLVNNYEDGNWGAANPPNQDPTNSKRLLGTNSVAGQPYANLSAINYGNAAPSTDVIIKGISGAAPIMVHPISVQIDNAATLGGFEVRLDGLWMDISRAKSLTLIHS